MTKTIERKPVPAPEPAKEPATVTAERAKVIDAAIAYVRKEFGGERVIWRLSETEDVTERFSTGLPKLDEMLGGGFPLTKLVQITGAESVGKSTFINWLAAQALRATVFVNFQDAEMSETVDRAEAIGVNSELMTMSEPETLEQSFKLFAKLIEHFTKIDKPSLLMLDSVAALPMDSDAEREFDEEGRSGERAAFLSKNLPKLVRPIGGTKVGMIFVNQVREKARPKPFEKPTYSPGGRALRHWCHLTLELRRVGQLKEKGEVVGIRSVIKVEKSKLNGIKPTSQVGIKIYFDGRIVEDDGAPGGDE